MHSQSLVAIALVAGAVSASPVYRRQATVEATVTATNTATVEPATTPGLAPTASTTAVAGETYPLYPCPEGYLLTYAQGNRTIGQDIEELNAAVGEWATAVVFPNITESEGGSTVGATHTWNYAGAAFPEVLVEADVPGESAFTQFVYNSTAAVVVEDVTLGQYQAVYKTYDPTFPITGTRGPSTLVQIFINACASDQDAARPLMQALIDNQLSQIGNDTDGNGGVLITSVLNTDLLTATEVNTAIATETNSDIASTTILATASEVATQTNTIIPATTSIIAATNQVTTTAATEQVTVTALTQTATTTAITQTSTAATVLVTADVDVDTVIATTTTVA